MCAHCQAIRLRGWHPLDRSSPTSPLCILSSTLQFCQAVLVDLQGQSQGLKLRLISIALWGEQAYHTYDRHCCHTDEYFNYNYMDVRFQCFWPDLVTLVPRHWYMQGVPPTWVIAHHSWFRDHSMSCASLCKAFIGHSLLNSNVI